ncbi:hypothetical protein GH714_024121 [Hevea brasiliensis]|uniref:Glutaredoxin domain-containing protein n=1 Tax=Hevea brasiliensis TaxID=3981 RepID=A0A6A6LAU2_HEVBR|nr:hypothetical protein GH714_024121 [Hevea brasiliensis]
MDRVRDLASTRAAVIFTKSSCCMCHSIKTLFYELGASPAIHELDRDASGREMEWALRGLGCNPSVPAVFIVKILFQGIGVEPLVYEIDQDPEGREMERALMRMGCTAPVPAVFIGGKLMGSTNEIMSLHLSGTLNQMLKPYQALS